MLRDDEDLVLLLKGFTAELDYKLALGLYIYIYRVKAAITSTTT